MKLFKKLVAVVATMSVCCTVAMPMSAYAIPTLCPPHAFVQENERTWTSTETHDFVYGVIDNGDGTYTTLYSTCTITTTCTYCDLVCTACGLVQDYELSKEVEHSHNCGAE